MFYSSILTAEQMCLLAWLKWARGRPEGNPGPVVGGERAKALHSLLLASLLLPFCFVTVLLNFIRDQANQMSHDINTDKYISEQPVRNH